MASPQYFRVRRVKMAALEKVKILVVGDSGVGKTSLVHHICHNETLSSPGWTIGCTAEVKLYEYREGTPGMKNFFLEFWDVGGSASHENSRSIFYNGVNGLILVHDLTNKKSFTNLRRWLAEVLGSGKESVLSTKQQKQPSSPNNKESWFEFSIDMGEEYDSEQFAGNQIPVIIIGTKLDQAGTARILNSSRSLHLAEEIGADMINLNCTDLKQFNPGSVNARKLCAFFDKVIERRFYSREVPQQSFGIAESPKFYERSSKRKMV